MIRIKHSLIFALAMGALSCGEKESEEPWGLVGTVKGKVSLITEFGALETNQSGATISFKTASKNMQATTGSEGEYTAVDVPMGTYNVLLEKPGFASLTVRSVRIVGGANPLYANYWLTRPSTTTVTNLTAIASSSNTVSLSGIVNHSNTSYFPFVRLVIFLGTSADVSPKKHVSSATYYFNETSGSSLVTSVYINKQSFPSGSTMYITAYGLASSGNTSINPDTRLTEYVGLSATPSNIASVKIP
jgi:hypothetical protein